MWILSKKLQNVKKKEEQLGFCKHIQKKHELEIEMVSVEKEKELILWLENNRYFLYTF